MKNSLNTNLISKLKLINVFLIFFGFYLIDIELKAHLRGNYSTESQAKAKVSQYKSKVDLAVKVKVKPRRVT